MFRLVNSQKIEKKKENLYKVKFRLLVSVVWTYLFDIFAFWNIATYYIRLPTQL